MTTVEHAMSFKTSKYRVKPGAKVDLTAWDTNENEGLKSEVGELAIEQLNERLEHDQEVLWAQAKHKVLLVLQATDTGGKDGTIRHVFDGVNPQGVRVASFKKPTAPELAHDYLWRVHQHTPGSGEMVIFNRSHYEDILVVRVHGWVPEEQITRRFHHIREFERILAEEGTTIVKFFLHISKDEQKRRLQDRLDDEHKTWKFAVADLEERKHWDAYQRAFTDMVAETSTDYAPWYVIPADRKWFRNLLVSRIVVETLEKLDLSYPDPPADLANIVIQ